MPPSPESDDPLARWLAGDGVKTLDFFTAGAMDVIGVIDRELTVRYVNWTAPGLTREGVVGNSVLDLIPPDYQEIARETYRGVLRTGTPARYETMIRTSEDVHIWDVRVGPIRTDGEQVVGIVVITSNVTEQRRATADRERFFALSLDMLVVGTPDGRRRQINPAFAEALGYDEAELIGTAFIELVHPDDRARTIEAYESVVRGNPLTDYENRCRRKDGEYRVFSWRSTVDPITELVYSVARDITDQRAMETQLRHAQKMEAVGQLAGGVAHDFNNLMLAVLGNAELALLDVEQTSPVAGFLREIKGAGHRAADLTKQLLAFSRRQAIHPAPVDVNRLIDGMTNMVRRLLPENIVVGFEPGDRLAKVNADRNQLEQVVLNLCVNARDAMEAGGHLRLQTEDLLIDRSYCESHPWARPGRFVVLRVADTGVGMTPEVRERAFEPFFTTKDTHQGTGLGLATVYGVVQQHDGLIRCHSTPGEGTTFEVYFPAAPPEASQRAEPAEPESTRGSETILLVEDEELVRGPLIQVLERAGYRALPAANGRDAVELLKRRDGPIHLVLLDVVMPGLSGPETWEQMRELCEDLRVVFTTGYADSHHLRRLPPGADVLQKPYHTHELLRRIRQTLDG